MQNKIKAQGFVRTGPNKEQNYQRVMNHEFPEIHNASNLGRGLHLQEAQISVIFKSEKDVEDLITILQSLKVSFKEPIKTEEE